MPDEHPSEPTIADLAAATPEEIAEALSYALHFDERGKPRRGGWDFTAGLAAERLAAGGWWPGRPPMRATQISCGCILTFVMSRHTLGSAWTPVAA
jgi:hypothetical protein